MQEKVLPFHTLSVPWVWSKVQSIFPKVVNVTYQIKGDTAWNKMKAHSLTLQHSVRKGWIEMYNI